MPLDLGLPRILTDLLLLIVAFALAFPIGWERREKNRPAGLRTFPIVALASCAFVLIGEDAFTLDPGAQARIIQGLMTGIGFIGGGAILKDLGSGAEPVRGIATAASIWNTGAIGAAVAYQRFEIAVLLSAANFLILRYLGPAGELAGDTVEDLDSKREGPS